MRCLIQMAALAAVALVTFAIGNVAADTVRRYTFAKSGLYDTMERLHRETKSDVIFANTKQAALSFDLDDGEPRKLLESAARKYEKDAVSVRNITVLEDALPDKTAPMDRVNAAMDWLGREGPDDGQAVDKRGAAELDRFADAVAAEAKRTATSLNGRDLYFSELSEDQRQSMVDLMRSGRLVMEAKMVAQILRGARYDQGKLD